MQLKYQIDGGAAVWFKKEPRKIYDLDALDSGVRGSGELSNCCLLLHCLSINRSQRSLAKEIDPIFDGVNQPNDWKKRVKTNQMKRANLI